MANLKRHTIELVKEVKEGELKTETFVTPVFLNYSLAYEAIDLMYEWAENLKKKNDRQIVETTADFVTRLYGKQFTKEELLSGIHAPELAPSLFAQVKFVAQGEQNEESKKFLEKQA